MPEIMAIAEPLELMDTLDKIETEMSDHSKASRDSAKVHFFVPKHTI